MCKFLSAIYVRRADGVYDLLTAPHKTDSHTHLEKIFGLKDTQDNPTYVKVEFVPPQGAESIANIDEWNFYLDDRRGATWFDDDRRDDCIDRLKTLVSAHIITDAHREIRDDWVIALEFIQGDRIRLVQGDRIRLVHSDRPGIVHGGRIRLVHGGRIRFVHGDPSQPRR